MPSCIYPSPMLSGSSSTTHLALSPEPVGHFRTQEQAKDPKFVVNYGELLPLMIPVVSSDGSPTLQDFPTIPQLLWFRLGETSCN